MVPLQAKQQDSRVTSNHSARLSVRLRVQGQGCGAANPLLP